MYSDPAEMAEMEEAAAAMEAAAYDALMLERERKLSAALRECAGYISDDAMATLVRESGSRYNPYKPVDKPRSGLDTEWRLWD